MSANTCGCGAPVRDSYLCRVCTRQLREALTDLAPGRSLVPGHALGPAGRGVTTRWDAPSAVVVGGLAVQLDATVARLARLGDAGMTGERPVNFHERAATVRANLVTTLGPWAARLLELERPTPQPPTCPHRDPVGADCRPCAVDVPVVHAQRRARWARAAAAVRHRDVGAMAAYLLTRLNIIAVQEDAPVLHMAVRDVVRRIERVIDREAEKVAAGECGAELPDETVCTRQLYADPSETYVVCPSCKTRWTVADRRAWLLAAAEDSIGNAATISAALTRLEQPVTAERIRKWKERGRLVAHSHEPPPPCRDHQGRGRQPVSCPECAAKEGAPLYRLGDVLDLLVESARAEVAKAKKATTKRATAKAS